MLTTFLEKSLSEIIDSIVPTMARNGILDELIRSNNIPLVDACKCAVAIYRIGHQLAIQADFPEKKAVISKLAFLQRLIGGCEIFFSANIGSSLLVVHGFGTVIGPRVTVGNNLTIYHGCTIGTRYDTSSIANAVIGNDVIIYAGAKILGNIHIGDGVVIGANTVVTKDIPAQSIVAGVPGKIIGCRVGTIADKYKLPPSVA